MIIVSNTAAQTLQPGQAITFNEVRLKTGCGEAFRMQTGTIGLRNNAAYRITFHANVGGTVAAAPVQLNIQLGGASDLTTTMISTPTTADTELNNVSASTGILTGCNGLPNTVTVANTGVNPIIIGANPSLMVNRVG